MYVEQLKEVQNCFLLAYCSWCRFFAQYCTVTCMDLEDNNIMPSISVTRERWTENLPTEYQPHPLLYFSVVVCLRCLLHHILSLIAYIYYGKPGFRFHFGLQIVFVCLYRTPYHHHCENVSDDIELTKCLSDIFCRVWDWAYSLSYPLYNIWGCVFSSPISVVMIERIYTLSCHHQIGSMNYSPLFRVRSWNNGIRCMSLYILREKLGIVQGLASITDAVCH